MSTFLCLMRYLNKIKRGVTSSARESLCI
uniref:Uncharacterized protein n=1 Tax=Arundo donax TaxID=35708 RepID=A0A0A9EEM3_ARUDO